jgi:uncharacterized protein YkuJ
MKFILSLGAINKVTGEYVYPKIANKKDKYICPECNKDLILCQGEKIVHHFRHKVDSVNPCHHFSKPTESQQHKEGKRLLKFLFESKTPISIYRCCNLCKKNEEYEIPEMTEGSVIQLEHRFEYNGPKIADVAYLDNGEFVGIFEICNTHKTRSEDRPEPWFEIDAETLIKMANDNTLTSLQIPCIRCEKCDECIETDNIISSNTTIVVVPVEVNTCPAPVIKPPFAVISQAALDHIISSNNRRTRTNSHMIDEDKYVYLNIDFSRKYMIKEYGGKWNKYHKLWYITKKIYNKNKNNIDVFIGDKIEWIDACCGNCNDTGYFLGKQCWCSLT